ncbi:MAG: divalent metal cation transporter, partial [Acetobacteraceae bacterium]|nr:divalent metal cation transporter [Acetobacteraceae bacterium]
SLLLPVPMVALNVLMRRPDLMGAYRSGRGTQLLCAAATVLVIGLNAILLLQTFGVAIPGMPAD